jgi:signal transduction histidine kinase
MYRCGKNLCFKISVSDITAAAIYGLTGAPPAAPGGGFLQLLQKIVAAAGAMTEAYSAAYLAAPGQCVTMVAGWRMPYKTMPPPWPLKGSLAGRVLTGGATKPVLLDRRGFSRFIRTDPLPRIIKAASFAGCPVRHADAAGVLCVFFTSSAPPATSRIDRLAGLAAVLQDALPLAEEFQLSQYRQHLLSDYVRRLASGMFDIVEQEKKQLARTLHDELGAMAVALDSHLTLAEDEIAQRAPKAALQELACMRATFEQSVGSLKQVAANLRPAELDIADTDRFFGEYLADLEKKTGLTIFFKCTIDMPHLPEPVTVALYRLLQESMNNIIKHARAGHASVLLQADRRAVHLHIVDDGTGFDPAVMRPSAKTPRLGLQGMRERVAALRGTFSLMSGIGDGTEIKIHIPLQEGSTHGDTGHSGR